jgi:hypothetical protein
VEKMKIVKETLEKITLESYLSSDIIKRSEELRENEGFVFTPIKNYLDSKNQTVYYAIGIK